MIRIPGRQQHQQDAIAIVDLASDSDEEISLQQARVSKRERAETVTTYDRPAKSLTLSQGKGSDPSPSFPDTEARLSDAMGSDDSLPPATFQGVVSHNASTPPPEAPASQDVPVSGPLPCMLPSVTK